MLEQYEPQTIDEFLGNKKALNEVIQFINAREKGKALFIHGQTGVGKSLCIRLIAKSLGMKIININSEQEIENMINSSKQMTLSGKSKLIVFDNLERARSMKKIITLIKDSMDPVILIAQNPYEQKFQSIRKYCKLVKFGKINHLSIASHLKTIAKTKHLNIDNSFIDRISKASNGDIRSALIDLQTCSLKDGVHTREREENIFTTLKIILKTHSIENASIALKNSEKTSEEIFRWVVENIANEYEGEDLARAYDNLSLADVFYSRIIKRQAWSLKKYFIDMGIFGVSMSKQQTYRKFFVYSFPQFRRNKLDSIMEKIGKKLFISKRKSRAYISLLKFMIKKNKKIIQTFGFDEDEIKLIKAF